MLNTVQCYDIARLTFFMNIQHEKSNWILKKEPSRVSPAILLVREPDDNFSCFCYAY